MGWEDHGLTFDVALHLGTLIALVVYYHREVWGLIHGAFNMRLIFKHGGVSLKSPIEGRDGNETKSRLALYLVIASIPGAIVGLLLEHKVETIFRSAPLVATTLLLMGVALWLIDKRSEQKTHFNQITLGNALLVGIAQGLAVVPGVSRSGITITTARLLGIDRQSAARFSFFLAMPITLGACVLKLRHLTAADLTPSFIIGVTTAAITGYMAIAGMLRYLQTRSYGVFAVYRFCVAALVFVVYLTGFRH
jgi:undecaprenyl-diphosphatase